MMYVKKGEEVFVVAGMIPVLSLTGTTDDVLERCRMYAAAGLDKFAPQAVPGMRRDLIVEFRRQVIARPQGLVPIPSVAAVPTVSPAPASPLYGSSAW